jgi:putative restriction endonuclease
MLMNSLERSLIKKAGYDNGWEVVINEDVEQVVLGSAHHSARAIIAPFPPKDLWTIIITPKAIHDEIARVCPPFCITDEHFGAISERDLCYVLGQCARLAQSLPDEPCRRFDKAVAEELANVAVTSATEVERLVRQRVGQNIYRESLMEYWGGACAVTGIALPELLRASHAKPWADCATDAERLNVFNGFLLCAHLDALFDRHLMTFDETGGIIFASSVTIDLQAALGMPASLRLRWVAPDHLPFLREHRARFISGQSC